MVKGLFCFHWRGGSVSQKCQFRRFEFLQRFDSQLLMNAMGRLRANTRYSSQQTDRLILAAQALHEPQPTCKEEPFDRPRQGLTDAG